MMTTKTSDTGCNGKLQRTGRYLVVLALCGSIAAAGADPVSVADTLSTAQTAEGSFISWREHIIDDPATGGEPDLAGSDGLAMADLNGDGFEDIVSVHESDIVYDGSPIGFIRIAWGTKNPDKWILKTLSSGPEAAAAEDVSIADANGDSHPDIVVACELAHLIYFQNPGADAENQRWERTIPAITTDRGSYIRVFFADFDEDGKPEVVASNKGEQSPDDDETRLNNFSIFVLPQDPLEGDLWREQVLGKGRIPINSEPVDLDSDGDLDVVAGARAEGRILWFENLGDMRFAEHRIDMSGLNPGVPMFGFNMDYADIDGDGRLDIVEATPRRGPLFWFRQPEDFSSPWELTEAGTVAPDAITSVRFADIDGDGDLDVFSGAYSMGPRDADGAHIGAHDSLGRIAWFENPGTMPFTNWERHDISRRKRGMYDKWIARDMDDDGDIDMVGTRGNSFPYGGVIWLEQVRSDNAMPAFSQARRIDSEQMPLPSENQEATQE